jgi:ATP-binding cassette, subfamily B, bacterial CvaB/MchF/RaxB
VQYRALLERNSLTTSALPNHSPRIHPAGLSRTVLVRQIESAECGLACVTMIANAHGLECNISALRDRYPVSSHGTSVLALKSIFNDLGFNVRALRCEPSELQALKNPMVLHWNFNHFVVLTKVARGYFYILDPARGHLKIAASNFNALFTGIALEISKKPEFARQRLNLPMRLQTLIPFNREARGLFLKAALVTVPLEILILAVPFYSKITIDQVAIKGQTDLLFFLTIAFVAFAFFEAMTGFLRGLLLQLLSAWLSYDMRNGLFGHLVQLPLEWFYRRQVGDIQSRFQSTLAVKQTLSVTLISSFFDATFAIMTFVVMYVLSPKLSLVAAVVAMIFAVVSPIAKRGSRRNSLLRNYQSYASHKAE